MQSHSVTNKPDTWIIPDAPKDSFATAWFRGLLYDSEINQQNARNLWLKWVPKKKNILVWRAIRGRLPSREVLDNLGVDVPDINCCVCRNERETVSHVFLSCEWAKKVWHELANWWNIDIEGCNYIDEIFARIDSRNDSILRKNILYAIAMATINIIWDHRNGVCFEKKEMTEVVAIQKVKEDVCIWIQSRSRLNSIDRSIWLISPLSACNNM